MRRHDREAIRKPKRKPALYPLPRHLLADARDIPKQGRVRRCAAVHQALEWFDPCIRQAEPAVEVIHHHVKAPEFGIFKPFEDRPIHRLAHAEHQPLANWTT